MANISKIYPQRPRIDNSVWLKLALELKFLYEDLMKAMIEMDMANSDEGNLKHSNEVQHRNT